MCGEKFVGLGADEIDKIDLEGYIKSKTFLTRISIHAYENYTLHRMRKIACATCESVDH